MSQKKVLVIGAGGREHALAWKLSQSPQVEKIYVAPGNDGFSSDWERWPASFRDRNDFEALADRAKTVGVDLVVIGPDNPLADGMVDVFEESGLSCFGPNAAAAQIEASKAFSKDVMESAGVPTAKYEVFSNKNAAKKFIHEVEWGKGWVVKADGLALGKGVRVCSERDDALDAIEALFEINGQLVIEEFLSGTEVSWMAFCDGESVALLDPARDYKPLLDGNQGPNTGGMGAFSPVPEAMNSTLRERVRKDVFEKTLLELKRRGSPFKGLLYAGLMVDFAADPANTGNGLWVLEFNARFGDPETQVLLPRMDADLYLWCEASAKGCLAELGQDVPFEDASAVVVVGAAPGYPNAPEKGKPISGPFEEEGAYFFAGIKRAGRDWLTHGGRVLGAVGLGKDLAEARELAYARISKVTSPGLFYRKDIAG